jgi:plastocyanin
MRIQKNLLLAGVASLVIIGGIYLLRPTKPDTESENSKVAETEKTPEPAPVMKAEIAPELTTLQTSQLKAGTDKHKAKALTFDVVGGNFYFVPNIIHVKKGDKLTINFVNAGGFHNWNLDEFNAKTDTIKTGETKTVTFTADKLGDFEYYCGVGKHRLLGQKGQLIVE